MRLSCKGWQSLIILPCETAACGPTTAPLLVLLFAGAENSSSLLYTLDSTIEGLELTVSINTLVSLKTSQYKAVLYKQQIKTARASG